MSPALAGGLLTTGPQEKSFTSSLTEWHTLLGFHCGSAGKESACHVGDLGLVPGLGRSPWRRERLPNPVLWPGEVHGVAKSWTRLNDFCFHFTHVKNVYS